MTIETNKAVVRRFLEGQCDYEKLVSLGDCVTPDFVFHDAIGDTHGVREFRDGVAEELEAFANVVVVIDDMVAEGDLVAVRYTTAYDHRGEFMHAYPPGKPIVLHGMSLHRVVDGRVAETWETYDRRMLARDLGAEQRLTDADESAIRDTVRQALQIGFADRAALASHYWAASAEVVASSGERMSGRTAILEWLQRFPPVKEWKMFDLTVDGAGEMAWVRGRYQMTLSNRAKLPFDRGQYLEIWRKQSDGGWRVIHTVYTSELASRSRRPAVLAHA